MNNNLSLTERSTKKHSKRLKDILHERGVEVSLCEAQNLFSKVLGFNNFHELKTVLSNEQIHIKSEQQFINLISMLESTTNCIKLDSHGRVGYVPGLHAGAVGIFNKIASDINEFHWTYSKDFNFSTDLLNELIKVLSLDQAEKAKLSMRLPYPESPATPYFIKRKYRINDKVSRDLVIMFYKDKSSNSLIAIKIVVGYLIEEDNFQKTYGQVKELMGKQD